MQTTLNQEGSENDPRQTYANFLKRQGREAGLGAREISERFALVAREQERKAAQAGNGSAPEHPINAMAYSKSHIDRVLKGKALPSPLWSFTLQFLKITSPVAGHTQENHRELCQQARELIKAVQDSPTTHLERAAPQREDIASGENHPEGTIAVLRLEIDLERARHNETRLRYALRDTQFLMATLWRIISALRDLISGHHTLEARVHHSNGDPAELARLRDETQQALAHNRSAHEEADRAAARLRNLEVLWEQARTEVHRLSMHPEAADLALPSNDALRSTEPVVPQDLLAQPALDDIAAALSKAKDLNTQEELAGRDLQHTVIGAGSINPDDEFAVLLAATRLTDSRHRRMALESLLHGWPDHADTRVVLLHLTRDADNLIRKLAVEGLAKRWAGEDGARDALVRLVHEAPDVPKYGVYLDHESVRAVAARGLAEGWPNDPHVRAILLHLTRDLDDGVRKTCAAGLAIAWPGDAEVRDALVRVVTEDEDEQVRADAARGLAKGWPGDAEVRALLLGLAQNAAAGLRMSAVCVMATEWSGDADIADALVRLSFDQDDGVRGSTESGLAAVWRQAAAVREAIFRLTRDSDHRTRILAAQKLAAVASYEPDTREALARLKDDADERVRLIALRMLIGWPDDPAERNT
ncbi:HEAT repeat domain-containing protein [Streptomyces sp. HUAS ZL42]|uniref:HEAT repeat domain-containing protein n=1 Tax=Streptomyces sp. HUAS ZL42 TaxID=3231715 RepID=UPI00345E6E41